jgi:predicted metal-dependent enzyme (double-stranded beta helix superfamily)
MDTEQLKAFVRQLAGRPDSWRHLVEHDRAARTYSELLRDDNVAAWLICWMDDHDTGFHDHDVSAGAVAVVSGSVREDRLVLGAPPTTRVLGPGDAFSFEASDIHRVRHAGAEPAVTIHAYSPPLWRMGAYEVQPEGRLLRHSISYAEELRPIGAAA